MEDFWMAGAEMSRQDFVRFLDRLMNSLHGQSVGWENDTLDSFLHAWAAWFDSIEVWCRNFDEPIPAQPSWVWIARMMSAAQIFE